MKIFTPLPATVIAALFLALAVLAAGCTQNQAPQQTVQTTIVPVTTSFAPVVQTTGLPGDTIRVVATSLGNILTDNRGETLYYFTRDTPAGNASACSGQCSSVWPAFPATAIVVSPPLAASDFSSFTRTDGTVQTTYRGWPLYTYQPDAGPGSVQGDGVAGSWFVASPGETVMVAQKAPLGAYLTDNRGNTLYFFAKDATGSSACTDTCIAKWPAFNVASAKAPSAVKSSDFGSIRRPEGVFQTTYMGRPLYSYSYDSKPGDTNGQGFGGVWFVANVSGTLPVTPATTPATTPVTTQPPSSMGYSSGGY